MRGAVKTEEPKEKISFLCVFLFVNCIDKSCAGCSLL
jgi:hypothetical protein